jgi:hypothetical protein
MSPTRSGYKELGLELVSLEEKISRTPKRPLMVGENKDDRDRRSLQNVSRGIPHATEERDDG